MQIFTHEITETIGSVRVLGMVQGSRPCVSLAPHKYLVSSNGCFYNAYHQTCVTRVRTWVESILEAVADPGRGRGAWPPRWRPEKIFLPVY